MTELEKKIKAYADAYYSGEELISDAEYDALLKQLRKENPDSEFLKGEILGDELKGISKKYKLPITMGSLSKCNTDEEMIEWWNKHPHDDLVAELKIDGNSQCLIYKSGKLVQTLSRGNGVYGEDTTAKLKLVQGVVHEMQYPFTGEIRGEVVMYRSTFDKHFKDTGKKNPRNAAAGIIGRLDGSDCDKLSFIAYDVFDSENRVDVTEIKKLKFLEENDFTVPEFKLRPTFEELLDWKNSIRNDSELPCDGIVIKQNQVNKSDLARLTPQNNVAFKPNLQVAITTAKEIKWQMRGSLMSPLVYVEPVELEGTTVTKASVANVNVMKKMGIYVGAKVAISKHGMIIPHIDNVLDPKPDAFDIPTICPTCGSTLVLNSSGFPECKNEDCSRKLAHKYGRMFAVLGIKNAGPAFIEALEEEGVTYSEFFKMVESGNADVLNKYAGGINGEKVLAQMKTACKSPITPAKYLAIFDYHGLGEKQFDKLGTRSLKEILKLSATELREIKGIGGETANAIIDFFDKDMSEILEISKYFVIEAKEIPADTGDKPTVCFTGACPGYTRSELAELAAAKYTVLGAVTKDLQMLVCADPNSGSSKLRKAAQNGTKVISYDEFLSDLGVL